VKIRVTITPFNFGQRANLYSVRLLTHAKSETDRFFARIIAHENYEELSPSLRKLLEWLERISRLDGAQERFFRPREGGGLALPVDKGLLRLYCYRFDEYALLLCGGGIKTSQQVKDSPDCLPHFDLMNSIVNELRRRKITPQQLPATAGSTLTLDINLPDSYVS